MYQIDARGGMGMEKPCDESIAAQHARRNQERVCEAGDKVVREKSISDLREG